MHGQSYTQEHRNMLAHHACYAVGPALQLTVCLSLKSRDVILHAHIHNCTAGSSLGSSALTMPPPPPPPPTHTSTTPLDPSVLGVGLIPPKLVTNILQGEYIEMREHLPESWHSICCCMARPKRGSCIIDFSLWTKCSSQRLSSPGTQTKVHISCPI